MVDYIDAHREEFRVEPICTTLQFAPPPTTPPRPGPPSARSIRDELLKPELSRIWEENYRVYGAANCGSRRPRRAWRWVVTGWNG